MTTPLVGNSVFDVLSRRPSELNQEPEQEQQFGALDEYDYRPYWQRKAQQKEQSRAQVHEQDRISPIADTLGIDQFASRLAPIRDIGQKALVGEQIAAQMRAERERQAAIVAAEKQRQQAWQDAMNSMYSAGNFGALNMMQYQQVGMNSSAGWGAGGAQGIANLMRQVGFPEDQIAIGIAIARGESGWNPQATGRAVPSRPDRGLFQINDIHKKSAWYPSNIYDPLENVKAAYNVWRQAGGSWRPWVVYQTGKYRQYLQPAPPIMKTSANPTVVMGNTTMTTGNGNLRMTAIQKGMNYISSGLGYIWGGTNLSRGVDCSGLVQSIYRQLGISLPRTAQQQAFYGTKAPVSQLRPGDLVAWNNGASRGLQVGHIAIYAGNGEIIESYQTGKPARRRKLSASEVNSGYAWGVKIRFPGE